MAAQHPFEALKPYLPAGSYELIMPVVLAHKVHLVLTRERQTKLGDYRHAYQGKNHRITVNANLHPYAFLITLIHELAHLLAFHQYGPQIAPHGREWKAVYGSMLATYVSANIFPNDVAAELVDLMKNPAATSGGEADLQRVLRRYESKNARPGIATIEELANGAKFTLKDGRLFERQSKLRKRIKCIELPTHKVYLFHPLYEVQIA